MKRIGLFVIVCVLLGCIVSCKRDIVVAEPVICLSPAYLPLRVIGAGGSDLLSPSALGGESIKLTYFAGSQINSVEQSVVKVGKDSFLLAIPLLYADAAQKVAIRFPAAADTMLIQTDRASSQTYGLQKFTYNGTAYRLQLVTPVVTGIEVRKTGADK